jgi:hypothetical protein
MTAQFGGVQRKVYLLRLQRRRAQDQAPGGRRAPRHNHVAVSLAIVDFDGVQRRLCARSLRQEAQPARKQGS